MRGRNAALIARFHPRYRSPKAVYYDVLRQVIAPGCAWLDLGCGVRVAADDALNRELPARARLAVGMDADPYLRGHTSFSRLVRGDASALPFRSSSFDVVTAAMVFEHVARPQEAFAEVARVLRPGGRLVVFTPNRFNYAMLVAAVTPHRFHVFVRSLMHYLNRGEWKRLDDEVFPTYYRANTARRLRQLAQRTGFRVERIDHVALAHSFGFVPPLFAASLLFERAIDRLGLHALKADLLGIFVRPETAKDTPR